MFSGTNPRIFEISNVIKRHSCRVIALDPPAGMTLDALRIESVSIVSLNIPPSDTSCNIQFHSLCYRIVPEADTRLIPHARILQQRKLYSHQSFQCSNCT